MVLVAVLIMTAIALYLWFATSLDKWRTRIEPGEMVRYTIVDRMVEGQVEYVNCHDGRITSAMITTADPHWRIYNCVPVDRIYPESISQLWGRKCI